MEFRKFEFLNQLPLLHYSFLMFSRLLNTNTAFFICDVQGCFLKSIFAVDEVIQSTSFLLKTARELEVPCVVTEQYPDKLKHTGGEKNLHCYA